MTSRTSAPVSAFARMGFGFGGMLFCFVLHDLGLFGGVEGPLQPGRIGARLAAAGVGRGDLLALLGGFTLLAGTWNWLVPGASRLLRLSRRRTPAKGPVGRTACLICAAAWAVAAWTIATGG
ncbi:MAG: hypothetical protein R6X25_03745 [Candidatus Krumholzibacteriia bacterium]